MHILQLSKRNGNAQERMLTAAKLLARAAEIDPALVEALTPTVKDLAVRSMMEREAVADLLEALAITAGVMELPADVTAEETVTTVTEPVSAPIEPTPETPADVEGLPEPVLEEVQPDEGAEPKVSAKNRTKAKKK